MDQGDINKARDRLDTIETHLGECSVCSKGDEGVCDEMIEQIEELISSVSDWE